MTESEPIRIELSEDEALVLFDWLCRFNDRKDALVSLTRPSSASCGTFNVRLNQCWSHRFSEITTPCSRRQETVSGTPVSRVPLPWIWDSTPVCVTAGFSSRLTAARRIFSSGAGWGAALGPSPRVSLPIPPTCRAVRLPGCRDGTPPLRETRVARPGR